MYIQIDTYMLKNEHFANYERAVSFDFDGRHDIISTNRHK